MRSRNVISAISLLAFLFVSGCITLGNPYHDHRRETLKKRIFVPEMQSVREDDSLDISIPAHLLDRPISLDDAIAIALNNNHTLRQAFEDMGIAGDDRDIARSLFLPAVSAIYAYDRLHRQPTMVDPENPLIPPMNVGEKEFRRAEIKIMMTIWDFGRSSGAYNQATLGRDITNLIYKRARRQVILDVVNAYFNVLRVRRGKLIAEESLLQANEHLKIAVNFERYGIVDMSDVLQARVQVAEMRLMFIKAKNAVELAISSLNSVLGININLPVKVIDNTGIISFLFSLEDCLQIAIENRPEFEVVQNAIRVEEEGIKMARAGHFPRVYVAGAYNWNNDDYQKFAGSSGTLHDENISAEIGIRIDFFRGGKITAGVRKAKRRLAKAEEKAEEVCDGISFQVKAAFLAVIEARDRIEVAKEAVAQSKENLRLTNNKYRENVVTSTDVVDAETLLTRAKQNYFNALYDHIVAIAGMENAVGKNIIGPEKAAGSVSSALNTEQKNWRNGK